MSGDIRPRTRRARTLVVLPHVAHAGTIIAERSRTTRPRVVIVDDQAGFRSVARRLLEARGYDVVAEAASGAHVLGRTEL